MATTEEAGPLWKRAAWFLGLWVAGVAALGTVAFVLRLWLV